MAQSADSQRSFQLYLTHVDTEGYFIKISGQLDNQSSLMVDRLLNSARVNFENGIGAVSKANICKGLICAAKYKDGRYYRAKIINTIASLAIGLVAVHFIDFGNTEIVSISTIRLLDNCDPMLLHLRGLATDYYLSRVIDLRGRWNLLLDLRNLLSYAEYPATVDAQTRTLPIISMQFEGNDLSDHLVAKRFLTVVPLPTQEVLLLQLTYNQLGNWSPHLALGPQGYQPKHNPFMINQSFPNPASAMLLNQNGALPNNSETIYEVTQRMLLNWSLRTWANLSVQEHQQQHAPSVVPLPAIPPVLPTVNKPVSSRLLEVNSQHKVYISFVGDGPALFTVQCVNNAQKLQDMMYDINRRPHRSPAQPPMMGTVCLGRMSDGRIICRAIVTNLSGSNSKLFFDIL